MAILIVKAHKIAKQKIFTLFLCVYVQILIEKV